MSKLDANQLMGIGPCVHVTVNDTARFQGTGNTLGVGAGSNGAGVGVGVSGMSGIIISKKELDFYTGMEYQDVTDEKFKPMFRELDLNNNGKLSAEEIEKYLQYCELKNEYENKKQDTGKGMLRGGLGTTVLGCFVGLLGSTKVCTKVGIPVTLLGLGLIVMGAVKNLRVKPDQYPDLVKGNEQYKNISNSSV